ncbi:peptide chain release factor N(5)-glutamine methyltransferase [Bacillus sp. H-16]|uniref:peptide chain release factor N(5)-glutamine methyltransferase n=1 Tax=Alteribacter salitolerans TaxID=2912333 RepID=UPI0019644048|nr:peptide chain release factor N(5)-glutamine methyltransferase [Alteribacter salitolerans]MBM7095572.1 peptide chain release factor N(5)-glutamine methyltransferase [Alteribacter salitolerans]
MEKDQRVYEALAWASSFLEKNDVEPGVAEVLLSHHTGWSRARWLSEMRTELDPAVWELFQRDVKTAATGVPVQHITGVEEFYGRTFRVSRDVLIPRPETEELIESVLTEAEERFPKDHPLHLVDVGTGSGIIAITLFKELKERGWSPKIQAVDISEAAIKVAKENARRLEAEVAFVHGDLLGPLVENDAKVDIVVSNPPYIPEGQREGLAKNVRDFDPETALFGGEDGLVFYRGMARQLGSVLKQPGMVAFEIGFDQGRSVPGLLQEHLGQSGDIRVLKDINGKDRIVLFTR